MTDEKKEGRDFSDAEALADMIQGLGEQHTVGCSSLEEDGSGCDCCLPAAAAFLVKLRDERDEARENLARGRFNAVWLTVGWCGLVGVYKHLAEGFKGIESYVKLVRAMEKPIVTAEWVATVTEANRG